MPNKMTEIKKYEQSMGIGIPGSNLAYVFVKQPMTRGKVSKGSIEALVKMDNVRSYKSNLKNNL